MTKPEDWKIYTRQGDKGKTRLIGGHLVPKYHARIECYGTLDELNSVIGMLSDQAECLPFKAELRHIQQIVFTLESQLAADTEKAAEGLPKVNDGDPTELEKCIDRMNEGLPPLGNFILPGGHIAVSWAHLARTVCRRAERLMVNLSENERIDAINLMYINRLSDYFFVLARRLSFDLKADEILWKPR